MKIIQDPSKDFIKEITPKYELMLHGTGGGTYMGADATLDIPDKINVPYVLDVDGTLIERFDPRYWAYHAGNNNHNKNTLAMEIVGWVVAYFHDGYFWTYTGKKISSEHVIKLNIFRGHEYFCKLTTAQELVLPEIITMFMSRFKDMNKIITHAEVNTNRLDFPPDYRQVYDIIDRFNSDTLIDKDMIMSGEEHKYTMKQIQARINLLIGKYGWSNNELTRLIKYRNSKRNI